MPCRTRSIRRSTGRGSPTTCSTPRSSPAAICAASATASAAICSRRRSATGRNTSASARRSRATPGRSSSRPARAASKGLIAKRADAPYVSTRSSAWLKLKCKKRQEFVVCGFTDRADDRNQVGSLLLGVYEDGALIPVGSVGTGWTGREATALRKKLAALEQQDLPLRRRSGQARPLVAARCGSEHWIEPVIVAEVEFAEITPDGQVRHASFVGLREDKDPAAVVHEV